MKISIDLSHLINFPVMLITQGPKLTTMPQKSKKDKACKSKLLIFPFINWSQIEIPGTFLSKHCFFSSKTSFETQKLGDRKCPYEIL